MRRFRGRPASSVRILALGALCAWAGACSFDYGDLSSEGQGQEPDLIMADMEYVRVRDGSPSMRLQAEAAERYEDARIMRLRDLRFEQYSPNDPEANAVGSAGSARIDLATGDAVLRDGVRVVVPSENLSISTSGLDWEGDARYLAADPVAAVKIERGDGTSVTGSGFSADIQSRTWKFSSGVRGVFVEEDREEEVPDLEIDAGVDGQAASAEAPR